MKRTSRWILWAALSALVINPGCRGKSAPEAAARAGEDAATAPAPPADTASRKRRRFRSGDGADA